MDITIHNNKNPARYANGRYFYTFTPRSAHDVLRIHHDNDCIGDTQLKKIQLERGTSPTTFETPQENHRALSGLFADLRNLNVELTNPNSAFWGKVKANNQGMLVAYFNNTIKSELLATAEGVTSRITNMINGDYSSLDQRLNALQTQIKNAAVTSTVQQLADRYTRQIETIDGRVSTVQQKADSLASQIRDAKGDITTLRQTASALEAGLSSANGNYTRLSASVSSLQTTVKDVAYQSDIRQLSNSITTQITSATGTISKVKQTADSLTVSLSETDKKATTANNKADKAISTGTVLRADLAGLTTRVSKAETGLSDITQEANRISTTVKSVQGDYTKLNQTVKGLTSTVYDVSGKYSTLKQTVDTVNVSITDLKGNYSHLSTAVSGFNSTVKSVSDKVDKETDKLATSISNVRQTAQSIQTTVDGLDGTISQLRQSFNSLTSRITQAQNTANGVAVKASEIKQTLDSISTYIGDRYGRSSTLTQDIDGLRSKIAASEYNYSNIKQSVNDISLTVNSLKNRSSVSVTDKGIVLASGEVIDGKKLAGMIAINKQGVKLIGDKISVTGNMIVDGTIFGNHLAVHSIDAGKIKAGAITSWHLSSNAIQANHINADEAFFKLFSANTAFLDTIFASKTFTDKLKANHAEISQADINTILANQIFVNTIQSWKIKAKQIDTETLNGKTINGVTLSGSSAIKIGERGSLKPVGNTLQIQAPNYTNSNSGVTVQISGKVWGDTNSTPSGVFIVMDPNFGSSNLYQLTNDILLTVRGRMAGSVPFKGSTRMATPVMTNFAQDDPIKGLFAIRFIGFDQDAHDGDGGIYFHDGTNGKPSTWWSYPNTDNSDKRLKENIHLTQHSSLALIDQLNFYEFDWKVNRFGNRKKHTNIGILADELQQLDSSLVFEEGDDKIKNIDTFRLLNVAVKAIQELNNKITHLERKYQHG